MGQLGSDFVFRRTAGAFVALCLCAAPGLAAAAAQDAGGAPTPAPASDDTAGGKLGAGTAGPGAPGSGDWVQQQIERLHRQLKITAAQEAAWTQFADARRAGARRTEQLYQDRSARFRNMNGLELVQNRRDIAQAQAEDLAKELAAFQALYGALGPEQKQAADRIFRYQEERREQRRMARHG